MTKGSPIFVTLVGGQLDGDSFILAPNASIAPLNAVEYYSAEKGGSWLRYEARSLVPSWPEHDLKLEFFYTGSRSYKNEPERVAPLGESGSEAAEPADEGPASGLRGTDRPGAAESGHANN